MSVSHGRGGPDWYFLLVIVSLIQRHVPASWKTLLHLSFNYFSFPSPNSPSSDYRGPSPGHRHVRVRQRPSPRLPSPSAVCEPRRGLETQSRPTKGLQKDLKNQSLEREVPSHTQPPFFFGWEVAKKQTAWELGEWRRGLWAQLQAMGPQHCSGSWAFIQFVCLVFALLVQGGF